MSARIWLSMWSIIPGALDIPDACAKTDGSMPIWRIWSSAASASSPKSSRSSLIHCSSASAILSPRIGVPTFHHRNEQGPRLGLTFAMGNDGGVSEPIDDVYLSLSEQPPSRRANVMAATGLAASLLLAVLTVVPAQYAIEGPGPTFDTLSASGDEPLVEIKGATTYRSTGELRLTTVSVSNASSQRFTVGAVIEGFFSPARTVQPVEAVLGSADDQKASEQRSAQQWISSQESATVSALEALGHEAVSYTHLRAHETKANLVCRLLLEKKKKTNSNLTKCIFYLKT